MDKPTIKIKAQAAVLTAVAPVQNAASKIRHGYKMNKHILMSAERMRKDDQS